MSSAVELHPVLTTGGLEERLFALQQLQDVMLRSQNVGDLEVAAGSLSQCFADFSSLEGPWSAMELETFYALLHCSNALCEAEGQGGFAYLFARPSCLMPIREALASAYDFEMHDEAVKLCAAVAVKFPLSVLRSMIPHDLLKAEVWPSLPLRARHVTLGMLYSAASIIQTREDAAMLLMLVPTLKDMVAAPPLPTAAARSNSRGGRSAAGDAALPLHLSTPSRASESHASSAGGSARGGASSSSSSGRTDTPHEAFTRELALRAVVRLLLISVGLCRFAIAVPPPPPLAPPLQARQALPADMGGGAAAAPSALQAEAAASRLPPAGADRILGALAAAGDAAACAAIDHPIDAAEPSAAANVSGAGATAGSSTSASDSISSSSLVPTGESAPTPGGVMPRTARTASSEAGDGGVGGLFDAMVASSGGSGGDGGIAALLGGAGSAGSDAASAIAAALATEEEMLQLQQDAYDEGDGDGGDGEGEGDEEEEEDEEGRGSGRALHAGAMRARRPGQRHTATAAPHAYGARAAARRPQREPVALQRPAWPRLSVLHMLRKCRMLRFLVRVLSAATRVQTQIPPAGARGAPASASAVSTAGGSTGAPAGASSGRVGVIVFPLTLYALRCVVRVLIRTLAFCRAEAAAQPSAVEAPVRRGVPAAAAAATAAVVASPAAAAGLTAPLAAERGAAATDAAATGAAAAPPALSPGEAAELRACCLRIIAGAPLGRYSNPQEREEALELCDDAGLLLLELQAHERQTQRARLQIADSERPSLRAAALQPEAVAPTEAAAAVAAAAPGSTAAALRMPRR
jgi:hypothetical protein